MTCPIRREMQFIEKKINRYRKANKFIRETGLGDSEVGRAMINTNTKEIEKQTKRIKEMHPLAAGHDTRPAKNKPRKEKSLDTFGIEA